MPSCLLGSRDVGLPSTSGLSRRGSCSACLASQLPRQIACLARVGPPSRDHQKPTPGCRYGVGGNATTIAKFRLALPPPKPELPQLGDGLGGLSPFGQTLVQLKICRQPNMPIGSAASARRRACARIATVLDPSMRSEVSLQRSRRKSALSQVRRGGCCSGTVNVSP